jgi:hypothetical protein
MQRLWLWIQAGYLRIIDPLAVWLVRHKVGPNTITTVGTLTYVIGGASTRRDTSARRACSWG